MCAENYRVIKDLC